MAIPDPATTNWVPIWNPLTEGPVGPTGPTGPQGIQGIPGNAVPHHLTHESGGIDEVLFPVGIKERGRTTPIGEWIDVAFNAANFTAGAGTWTVTAGNVTVNRYTLIGKTMIWTINVGASSVAGGQAQLFITVPGGFTVRANMGTATGQFVAGASNYVGFVYGSGATVTIQPHPFTAITDNSGGTYLVFTISLELL